MHKFIICSCRLRQQPVFLFSVVLFLRISTTLIPSLDYEFEIHTMMPPAADDGFICARMSTMANLLIWVMMPLLLLLPIVQIKRLIQFGVTPNIIAMNLCLLAYECFAVYINYLTWSSDLSIATRLFQIIPTIIVILHSFSEVEFLYLNKRKCPRSKYYFFKSSIDPFFFATFNICLNGAMILHLIGVVTVASIRYPYLFDAFLAVFGLGVAAVKLLFRLHMIYKYLQLLNVHFSHKGEVQIIEAAQNDPSVSLSTSAFAVEKDNLRSLKQGQLVAILQRLNPVFKDFAHTLQLNQNELVL